MSNKEDLQIDAIRKIVCEIINDDTAIIEYTTDLIEAELIDSMDIIMLITQLEETFSIDPIDVDDIVPENFSSIQAIYDFLTRQESCIG